MSTKEDLPDLIILTQREHQRLKNQAKRLAGGSVSEQALRSCRANWLAQLGFVAFLPPLLKATDDLLDRLNQGKPTEEAYEEMAFQIGFYRKGTWGFIRQFYGSLNPYVDRWLKVLPSYRQAFARRYEAHSKLSVAEQGALIRGFVEAVPNKDDPYNLRQSQEGRALLKELETLEEARDRESKPANTGQVVDLQAFKHRRR